MKDLNKDTVDKHDDGNWAGWVFQSVFNENDGSASPAPVYLTIDADRRTVSFGATKRRPDITHNFIDLEWPCSQAAPCTPLDFGIATKKAEFAKLANSLAVE